MGRTAVAVLSALALLPAAPAHGRDFQKSRHLWATVNVCDTERNPDTLGIRASMPGLGRKRETLWMRFRVQYFSPTRERWHNFASGEGTDSGYVKVARHSRFRARQSGYLFPFSPEVGDRYRLRGSVEFQWRKRGRVRRNARELTTGGHRPTVADPRRYSAPTCDILG